VSGGARETNYHKCIKKYHSKETLKRKAFWRTGFYANMGKISSLYNAVGVSESHPGCYGYQVAVFYV
jgi:hypothetical protein